jgi:predicted DNA-binding protein (MmcQ/YjbR family)
MSVSINQSSFSMLEWVLRKVEDNLCSVAYVPDEQLLNWCYAHDMKQRKFWDERGGFQNKMFALVSMEMIEKYNKKNRAKIDELLNMDESIHPRKHLTLRHFIMKVGEAMELSRENEEMYCGA